LNAEINRLNGLIQQEKSERIRIQRLYDEKVLEFNAKNNNVSQYESQVLMLTTNITQLNTEITQIKTLNQRYKDDA